MKALQVKLNLSTAFHPQTDGQSERAFRSLEEMLRCFVNSMQNDWDKFLPSLELAYNNSVNESTKHTPFFLAYGQHPLSISDILQSESPDSDNQRSLSFLQEDIQNATKLAKIAIQHANGSSATFFNKNRQQLDLQVGDKVWLSTTNLPIKKGKSKKLLAPFIGPLTILERLASGNAYKLNLPATLKYIHPVFHVSLLKPYFASSRHLDKPRNIQLQATRTDKIIEKFLSHRIRNGEMEFLVHYKNSDPIDDQWIPKEDTHAPRQIIRAYQDKQFEQALEDELLS